MSYLQPMKKLIILLFFMLLNLSFAQEGYSEKIDSLTGLGPFYIDAKFSDLETFLDHKLEHKEKRVVSSYYDINLDKLNIHAFFGLPIIEMTVQFNENWNIDGKSTFEDVFRIDVKLTKPDKNKALKKYQRKLKDYFGQPEMMTGPFETDQITRYQWWSEKTLLAAHFGFDPKYGNELDYFLVTFYQRLDG